MLRAAPAGQPAWPGYTLAPLDPWRDGTDAGREQSTNGTANRNRNCTKTFSVQPVDLRRFMIGRLNPE